MRLNSSGTLVTTNDATIRGITVGQGGGSTGTNTALGFQSLNGTNSGTGFNIGVGYQALFTNTTGERNSVVGVAAMYLNTTGSFNTALGMYSLYSNTTASDNTAIGYASLFSNTTGADNTAVGNGALQANTTASYNTAVGYQAGFSNTTGGNNTSVGGEALYNNTTGVENSAFGVSTLRTNTTGSYNTAYGRLALNGNTTAVNNTSLGYEAGRNNTTANSNVYIGFQAGATKTTGGNNTFVGTQAGFSATTGTGNCFVGVNDTTNGCGYAVTTGSKNTIIGGYTGNQGGLDIRTANNHCVISDGDGNPRIIFNDSGNIYAGGAVDFAPTSGLAYITNAFSSSPRLQLAHPSTTASGGGFLEFLYNATVIGSVSQNGTTGVLYNTSSDYRLKDNPQTLTGAKDFILALQPKTWTWKSDGSKGTGFIAHEAQAVATQSVAGEKDAIDENGNPSYQSMQAGSPEIIANLVALVQELTAEVDSLKQQLGN
jgi:hypothetical protein